MSNRLAFCMEDEAKAILFPVVDDIVRRIVRPIALARDPTKTGGVFVFWRSSVRVSRCKPTEAMPFIHFLVGELPDERFFKYFYYGTEKPNRLSLRGHDVSSAQSRDDHDPDPKNHKYGGAIAFGIPVPTYDLIFSFSGFSELEDEMVCTLTANRVRFIGMERIHQIIEASHNQLLADYIAQHPQEF